MGYRATVLRTGLQGYAGYVRGGGYYVQILRWIGLNYL